MLYLLDYKFRALQAHILDHAGGLLALLTKVGQTHALTEMGQTHTLMRYLYLSSGRRVFFSTHKKIISYFMHIFQFCQMIVFDDLFGNIFE